MSSGGIGPPWLHSMLQAGPASLKGRRLHLLGDCFAFESQRLGGGLQISKTRRHPGFAIYRAWYNTSFFSMLESMRAPAAAPIPPPASAAATR